MKTTITTPRKLRLYFFLSFNSPVVRCPQLVYVYDSTWHIDKVIDWLIDWLIVRRLNHILPLTQAYPVPTYPILHRHLPRMQSALTSQFEHLSTKGSQKTAMWYIIDVLHLLYFNVRLFRMANWVKKTFLEFFNRPFIIISATLEYIMSMQLQKF